jgi:hypothetical protein
MGKGLLFLQISWIINLKLRALKFGMRNIAADVSYYGYQATLDNNQVQPGCLLVLTGVTFNMEKIGTDV